MHEIFAYELIYILSQINLILKMFFARDFDNILDDISTVIHYYNCNDIFCPTLKKMFIDIFYVRQKNIITNFFKNVFHMYIVV